MMDVPISVWCPLGGTREVMHVASDAEHLGNRVAEGALHPSMFWPMLARLKSGQANRNRAEFLEMRSHLERRDYASQWVSRWLEDERNEDGAGRLF